LKALEEKKKKNQLKKSNFLRDEGAFNTYLYRVLKETCPDTGISKKAMVTLNQIMVDKFEEVMLESRSLVL